MLGKGGYIEHEIPQCCPERVEDPSRPSPDVHASRVFFFTDVSPRR